MAKIFNLPAVGDTMVEGEIVAWLVAVGDVVDLDQPICEIETDKSVVEMTTPHRGTVLHLGADVGGVVEVGSPLIIVGDPGEMVPELAPKPAAPAAAASSSSPTPEPRTTDGSTQSLPLGTPKMSPLLRRFAHEEGVDLSSVQGTGPAGRITRADILASAGRPPVVATSRDAVRAMPKVRRLARQAGIDLTSIPGTGPRGSIALTDLPALPAKAPIRGRRERLSAMRRSIARNLTEAAKVPQFTSMVEFDASNLVDRRAALREDSAAPVPLDALLMSALIEVLGDHPLMNAQLVGEEVEYYDNVDIGLAVDTPDGLMVPVVRAADSLDEPALAAEIIRLAVAARERKITPQELTGGTCTVNNVGALGILAGTPILPLATSTIVAFGASRSVVVLRDERPVEVQMATISATFDHRLIDGGGSARFLKDLTTVLERP